MAAPIFNPPIPFVGPIPGGMSPGKMIFIQGFVAPSSQSFAVNLQCGPNTNPRDDLALHINPRFGGLNVVVRNSLQGQIWGMEDSSGPFPFHQGQQFEMIILSEIDCFKIAVNGQHFASFPHRIPVARVSYLAIDGDVNIACLRFETNMPQQQPLPGFVPGQVPAAAMPPTISGYQPQGSAYGMPSIPASGYGQYLPASQGLPYGAHSPSHSPMHSSSSAIPVPGGHGHGLPFHTAPIVYPMGVMMGKHHMSKEMKKMHKHEKKMFKHKHKHHKLKLKHMHHHGHKKGSSSSSSD